MIRIGIIGDIGSGKSHTAKQFGYPVFNADLEVSKLYKSSRECYLKIKKALPKFISSFPIKKNELSKSIVENQKNIKKIIKIIHPEIQKRMNAFVKKNKNKKFIVLDIPLLIENKISKKNDIIVFVDAKKRDINKRLQKRVNFNPKIIKKFKKIQLPLEVKKKYSDFIIKNNFNNKSMKKNVKRIMNEILKNA